MPPIPPQRRFAQPPPQRPTGATGIAVERPNRNMPSPAQNAPATTQGQSDRQTECFTYFTKIGQATAAGAPSTPLLYNGDRIWAEVYLTLETAGPVAVGTRADLFPVLSGKGTLLDTGVRTKFTVAKGYSRLYIASTSISRVKVVIEPFPWIEQIAGGVESMTALLGRLQK